MKTAAPVLSVVAGLLLTIGFFVGLSVLEWFPSHYFIPYSKDVVFFDTYKIDTIEKFIGAWIFVAINTGVNSYILTIFRAWQVNFVNDPKTPRCHVDNTDFGIHLAIQIFNVYSTLAYSINIFFVFTNVYFILSQLIARAIVSYYTTDEFIKLKAKEEKKTGEEHSSLLLSNSFNSSYRSDKQP